jgi:proteasome activator subunit 4
MATFWAQEDTRNYPSSSNIDLVIASTQLFGPVISDLIRPIIDGYLAEMSATKIYDRHKTRALWELLTGILRGSGDWSGNKRKQLWNWATPKLPELFSNIRHDTTKCFTTGIAYLLEGRDPRRNPDLINFLIETGLNADFVHGSSFECEPFSL